MHPLNTLIRDRDDLAEALQISREKLSFLANAPAFRKYTKFAISKRDGSIRIIEAPQTSLKVVQKKLYEILEPYYSPPNCVHGFISGKSIITGAFSHLTYGGKRQAARKNTRFYFVLDIEDFFPSITSQRIYGLLTGKFLHATECVAFDIAKLCIGEHGLAQGSPVSPLISNMICLNMDRAILAFAKKNNLFYTRYADDIVLSTSNRKRFVELFNKGQTETVPDELRKAITEHKGKRSFCINEKKTRCLMPNQQQLITGIVTNEKLNVPRKYYKTLRSCLHTWKTVGKEKAATKYYGISTPENVELSLFEMSVYGKLDYYRNIVASNNERCTSLEKLGSLFNQCCEGRLFPIHKPEDSIFKITVYPINNADLPEEGIAFLLDGIGIVTARHIFDKYAMDGVSLKLTLTSVATNEHFDMTVPVSRREAEQGYDCVKICISKEDLSRHFPTVSPLSLADFSQSCLPIGAGDRLTAFGVELVSDVDQEVRGYECAEVQITCKQPSKPNQYGRMAQVDGAEFYKGMSGGPVINSQGKVVGIVKSGIERGSGSRCARSKLLFLDRLSLIPYGIAPKE